MPEQPYSAAEVDAAVQMLADPARLAHAQEIVTHAAPSLHGVLAQALQAGGWFSQAHEQQLAEAVGHDSEQDRSRAVANLVDEETRLGMLVGVAVGFELANELRRGRESDQAPRGGE
ncbi:MAG TPA: hypothetical protein VID48_11860 [Solirubrobacteraceae bacterium]